MTTAALEKIECGYCGKRRGRKIGPRREVATLVHQGEMYRSAFSIILNTTACYRCQGFCIHKYAKYFFRVPSAFRAGHNTGPEIAAWRAEADGDKAGNVLLRHIRPASGNVPETGRSARPVRGGILSGASCQATSERGNRLRKSGLPAMVQKFIFQLGK